MGDVFIAEADTIILSLPVWLVIVKLYVSGESCLLNYIIVKKFVWQVLIKNIVIYFLMTSVNLNFQLVKTILIKLGKK